MGGGVVQILLTHLFIAVSFCFSGTQISCFSPSSFSWRQAAFVDSYCWAAVQQKDSLQGDSGHLPLWLHKVTGDVFSPDSLVDVGTEARRGCATQSHRCAWPASSPVTRIIQAWHFKFGQKNSETSEITWFGTFTSRCRN